MAQLICIIDTVSILIVFGGTAFVLMMKYNLGQFIGVFKIALKAFLFKVTSSEELILKSVEMADAARKGGFLALEEAEISNSFMQKGVDLLVDGHYAEVLRSTLEKDIRLTSNLHELGADVFKSIGDVAPAMAVALLTTLYGAMVANMVAIPISDKLRLRAEEEKQNRNLILDAVLGIQDGQNPRVIEALLRNYLPESKRNSDPTEKDAK